MKIKLIGLNWRDNQTPVKWESEDGKYELRLGASNEISESVLNDENKKKELKLAACVDSAINPNDKFECDIYRRNITGDTHITSITFDANRVTQLIGEDETGKLVAVVDGNTKWILVDAETESQKEGGIYWRNQLLQGAWPVPISFCDELVAKRDDGRPVSGSINFKYDKRDRGTLEFKKDGTFKSAKEGENDPSTEGGNDPSIALYNLGVEFRKAFYREVKESNVQIWKNTTSMTKICDIIYPNLKNIKGFKGYLNSDGVLNGLGETTFGEKIGVTIPEGYKKQAACLLYIHLLNENSLNSTEVPSNNFGGQKFNLDLNRYGQDLNQEVFEFKFYNGYGWLSENGHCYISVNGGETAVFVGFTVLDKLIKDGFAKLYGSGKKPMGGVCKFDTYGQVIFYDNGNMKISTIKGLEKINDRGRSKFYESAKKLLGSDFGAQIIACNGSMSTLLHNNKTILDIVGDTSSDNYSDFASNIDSYLNVNNPQPNMEDNLQQQNQEDVQYDYQQSAQNNFQPDNFYQQNQQPDYQQQGTQYGYPQSAQYNFQANNFYQQNQQTGYQQQGTQYGYPQSGQYNFQANKNVPQGRFMFYLNKETGGMEAENNDCIIRVLRKDYPEPICINDYPVFMKMLCDKLIKLEIKWKKGGTKDTSGTLEPYFDRQQVKINSKNSDLDSAEYQRTEHNILEDKELAEKYDYVKEYCGRTGIDFEAEMLKKYNGISGNLENLINIISNNSRDSEEEAWKLGEKLEDKFIQQSIDEIKERAIPAELLTPGKEVKSYKSVDDLIGDFDIDEETKKKICGLGSEEKKINAIKRLLLRIENRRANYKKRSLLGKMLHRKEKNANVTSKKINSCFKSVAKYIVKCIENPSLLKCQSLLNNFKPMSGKSKWEPWYRGFKDIMIDANIERSIVISYLNVSDSDRIKAVIGMLFVSMIGLGGAKNVICACDALKNGGIDSKDKSGPLADANEIRKAIKAKCSGGVERDALKNYIRKLCVNDYRFITKAGFDDTIKSQKDGTKEGVPWRMVWELKK